jgi:hypothetical protein
MLLQVLAGEVGRSNLLSDTASFASLHVGLSQLIQNQRFTGIDVPKNTNNWTSQLFLLILHSLFACSGLPFSFCEKFSLSFSSFKCGLIVSHIEGR